MGARNAVKRSDENTAAIVKAIEKTGATVCHLGGVGGGCPDLLVGHLGVNILLEVKMPGETLNETQEKWHAKWRGQRVVVRDEYEAMFVVLKLTAGAAGIHVEPPKRSKVW